MKILAENQYKPNFENRLKKNETLEIEETLRKILQKGELFSSYQKNDLMEENENFEEISNFNKTINFIITIQIFIVIIISVLQLWRMKKNFI